VDRDQSAVDGLVRVHSCVKTPKPRQIWFTDRDVEVWVERTRRAQGLPATVSDPVVLAKVVKMIQVFRTHPASGGSKLK
jgi:hypothetical protein